jgi:hypothetical protein
MLEMKMEKILNHPVIIEVLNLVYEGKYSIDSSSLSLSFTLDLKSILERVITNIKTIGESVSEKQSALQFNIWKYCI